jgi:hypothetical protein
MSRKTLLTCTLLAIGLFSSGSVTGNELRSFESVNKDDFGSGTKTKLAS